MPAAKEEIFGPVLSIVRVNNLDEAANLENGNCKAVPFTPPAVMWRKKSPPGVCRYIGVNIGVPVLELVLVAGMTPKFMNITGWDGYRFWTKPRKISSKWAYKDTTWMS